MRVVAATERLARNTVALRISVGLIPKAARDLRRTQERSGLSVADIVNRALTLYEFVDSGRAAGDQMLDPPQGRGGPRTGPVYLGVQGSAGLPRGSRGQLVYLGGPGVSRSR